MEVEKHLEKVGKLLVQKLIKDAKSLNHVASREMINTMTYESTENEVSVLAKRYALAISEGSKPASKSTDTNRGTNIYSRILKWIKVKGIKPRESFSKGRYSKRSSKGRFVSTKDYELRNLSYVIGRSILRKGLLAKYGHNKGSAFIELAYKSLEDKIGDEIAKGFIGDIEAIIGNTLNTTITTK